MKEPATALTDLALALQAGLFLVLLPRARSKVGARLFFAGFAAAAALGVVDHGFLVGDGTAAERVNWWLTLTCTGVAAFGLAAMGVECLVPVRPRRVMFAGALFACGFALYAWNDPCFLISVVASGVGSLLAFAGLARHARAHPGAGASLAIAGLLLSLVAGALQQQRLALHPEHFDHNATYHVILMPALALLFAGSRRMVAAAEA